MDRTIALILAADEGAGFRGPKYLAPHRGVPLLRKMLRDAVTWPVDDLVVVLGADAERVVEAVDVDVSMVIIDPLWREGIAASLRVGLDAVSRDTTVVDCVLARGDQIGVTAGIVEALLEAHRAARAAATVPKYRYARGWPIVVAERMWSRFMGLEGAVDLLDVLSSHPEGVCEEWFDRLSPPIISSPDDLPNPNRR